MTDIIWVGLISAGGAVSVALLSQWMASRIASKQADRSERREQRQWERLEARRQEEIARENTKHQEGLERAEILRVEELQMARLQECWLLAHEAHACMLRLLASRAGSTPSSFADEEMPSVRAQRACGAALLGLASVYPVAMAYYGVTVRLQELIRCGAEADVLDRAACDFYGAYTDIENEIARLTGVSPLSEES